MAAFRSERFPFGILTIVRVPVQLLNLKWTMEYRVEERNTNGALVANRGFYSTLEKAEAHFDAIVQEMS